MTLPVEQIMQENDDVLTVGKNEVLLQEGVAPYQFENCTTLAADQKWWNDRVCPDRRGRPDPSCVQGKEYHGKVYQELWAVHCASPSATPSSVPDPSFPAYECECIEFQSRKPNVIVFEDLDARSDSQGAMMVGGNANIRQGFSIGLVSNASTPFSDMLFVGGDLNFPSGSVVGNVHYGGQANLGSSIRNSQSKITNDLPVDFDAVQTHFEILSASMCAKAPTGGYLEDDRVLRILRGNAPIEVFKVKASTLNRIQSVDLSGVSASATVIMNVFGNSVNFNYHQTIVDNRHIVWNFCDASEISISKCEVSGSFLAPLAHVTGTGGVIQGQFVAKSYTGTTQFNDNPCVACIN